MVFRTVGLIVLLEALLLALPTVVGLIYREASVLAFLISIAVSLLAGGGMILFSKPKNRLIYAKEGFAITSLAWLFVSLIGALPFYLSRQIPSYVDAFFETVSGFTTTGASIVSRVEDLDHALLFWCSFTHWVGGMGVLVFLMVFISNISDRTIHIARAEMPGPTMGKLLPKLKDTAKILYLIYIVITTLLILLLWVSGMSLFDSMVHSFGTTGTGGFGIHSDSVASLSNLQIWIITVFMLLSGINFNLYYLALIRRFRTAVKSTELWVYLGIFAFSTAIICWDLTKIYDSFGEIVKHGAFQVSSIMTTTGFSSADFNLWPSLSKTVLLVLMFIGACAGSTAGGLKVSRIILFFKSCHAEIRHLLHPRSVNILRMDGKKVEKETQKGVMVYFVLYMLCFFGIFLLLSIDGFDFETNFSAVAACFNNIGPGLSLVGPLSNFSAFSDFSKLLLSFAMLLGRLEIWPILLTLCPGVWTGQKQ